jgi:hypothetical protein
MKRATWTIAAAAMLAALGPAAPAPAQSSIDQIEEDWELIIGVPDPSGSGPQISTWLCPVQDNSLPCFVFNLNYREAPSFNPGGIEVQVWDGERMLSASYKGTASLGITNEPITWTQRMRISSGVVSFGVDSGRSTTWGKFGQGQQMNASASFTAALTSLAGYSPSASIANSGVGWQPNRVQSMKIVQVRYYSGGKLVRTDSTPKTVSLTH